MEYRGDHHLLTHKLVLTHGSTMYRKLSRKQRVGHGLLTQKPSHSQFSTNPAPHRYTVCKHHIYSYSQKDLATQSVTWNKECWHKQIPQCCDPPKRW
ncbi:hypothetical protein BaRGS_00034376 [Batillaria attramentaria]|uniref:Uncharacterized protein n=1 Tax=Batillaria attramentaria TaxID=370345 RepID=A0ABD0JJ11_9CAEN